MASPRSTNKWHASLPEHACALAVAGLTLGDTIRQWDTADTPTGLPEAVEPQPGAAERVFIPAVLQGR